jgi:hypothetical protein
MIVLIHVLSAVASLVTAGSLLFKPSLHKLYATISLVATTLLSGTYLVIATKSSLTPACTAGALYLSAVSISLFLAYRKLTTVRIAVRIDESASRR